MALRLAVLTTDTAHHRWFLQQLPPLIAEVAELALVVFETKRYPWERNRARFAKEAMPNVWRAYFRNPYTESPQLTAEISRFELESFFPDGDSALPIDFPGLVAADVNDATVVDAIDDRRIDLALVYGTGLVKPHVFDRPPLGSVNAHGGLLPGYRGLDTNLWATYLGHPEDMAVTLHHVDKDIDTGKVYAVRRLGAPEGLSLTTLRYHTTMLCTAMFAELVHEFARGTQQAVEQRGESRYFKPMPTALKRRTDQLLRDWASKEKVKS